MRHKSSANALMRASVALLLAAALAACGPSGPARPAGVTPVVAADTPTPFRYPTLPPEWTSTWTPAPTIQVAAPTGTAAPSQSPVPPTPNAAPPAKRTACDHPYLPLRQGAHWNYQMQAGPMTWTVTDITGDMNNAAATVVAKFPSSTSTYHFFCDAAGLRTYDIVAVLLQAGFVLGPDDPDHGCVKPCLNYRQRTNLLLVRLLPDGTFVLDMLPGGQAVSRPTQGKMFAQIIDALYPEDVLATIDRDLGLTLADGVTQDSVDGFYILASRPQSLGDEIVVSIR